MNAPGEDGELLSKQNIYTETKTEYQIPKFCRVFPDKWFNEKSRFDNSCIEPSMSLEGGLPQSTKVPHPLALSCLNPLEVAALIAIAASMVRIFYQSWVYASILGSSFDFTRYFRYCPQVSTGRKQEVHRQESNSQKGTERRWATPLKFRPHTKRTSQSQLEMAFLNTRMMESMEHTSQVGMKFTCFGVSRVMFAGCLANF